LGVDYSLIAGTTYTESLWVEAEKLDFWIKTAEKVGLAGFETPGATKAEDIFTNEYNPFYLGIFDN